MKYLLVWCLIFFINTLSFAQQKPVKYVNQMSDYTSRTVKNLGLQIYYDYDEALEASKAAKNQSCFTLLATNA